MKLRDAAPEETSKGVTEYSYITFPARAQMEQTQITEGSHFLFDISTKASFSKYFDMSHFVLHVSASLSFCLWKWFGWEHKGYLQCWDGQFISTGCDQQKEKQGCGHGSVTPSLLAHRDTPSESPN